MLRKQHAPVPKSNDNPRIIEGYGIYRQQEPSPNTIVADNFKTDYSWPVEGIKFIGVWNTVGSLGIPLEIFNELNEQYLGFHGAKLNRIVENAYHAVATYEHRADYERTT